MLADLFPQHSHAGGEVDGGGLDVGMPEHLLEAEKVAAAFEHEGSEGVPLMLISALAPHVRLSPGDARQISA